MTIEELNGVDSVVKNSELMIRKGSKSFSAAARLFDVPTRESAYMLYAWCRYCDDEIDGQALGMSTEVVAEDDADARGSRLRRLYRMTRDALHGGPVKDPVFVGFQRVVRRHDIPDRYPLELLEGFAMDVGEREYRDLDDTLLYCYHVAGVVGVMMAQAMGLRDRETLHRAADLGIAFQLTNIARDVIEDARAGRVYLPSSWLAEAGISPADVGDPEKRAAVFAVVDRLLREADRYYASANQGLPSLGLRAAWAVATARGVYRDIGKLVLKRGPRAWNRRAVVSRPRKLFRATKGLLEAATAVTVGRLWAKAPRQNLWTKADPSERTVQGGIAEGQWRCKRIECRR